jgi:hypothetical protein
LSIEVVRILVTLVASQVTVFIIFERKIVGKHLWITEWKKKVAYNCNKKSIPVGNGNIIRVDVTVTLCGPSDN